MRHFAAHDQMDADRLHRLEELAFQHAAYSDSYLITEPNREYLWSSDDRAVVGFARVGRYLHVAGGILGHDIDKPRMLAELVQFARQNRVTVSFFHIDDRELPMFHDQGFQVTQFGVESRVPLAGHSWSGKQYEWVRRQSNYVGRHGIVFEEWTPHGNDPELWPARLREIEAVSHEHMQSKTQTGEIPFFEGRILDGYLHRRRVFVARNEDGQGRVEGFLMCNPMEGGAAWAVEMYRQRGDAVRGTIPFLMHQAIERFKQEGCREVSICPIPTIGCDRKRPGDSFVVRLALNLWRRFGYAMFDINGLYHFKSRFRPEFRDMFVCAYPKSSLGATVSYMRLVGMLKLHYGAFFKKMLRWNPQRRTLARPEPVPQAASLTLPAENDESQIRAA